ncbi:MAG: class II fructose-bisphosphate aldolase [Pseudomonadota bacterium]|nr:class II fructose-bisphosphate aldolase [Pseudomonadota bacterium]
MTVATLSEVLQPALRDGYAVAGLVVLGWEDARAFVTAAEAERLPVILQAGPACRAHTPLPIIASMFRHLAEHASVPVVLHLDHGYSREECRMALDLGFTSVMYDGSRKPLEVNIAETAAIAEMAHAAGASCEGEIGFVGYHDGAASEGTDPAEAAIFAEKTGVDAMAISIGNVHLQSTASSTLDEARLRDIQALTGVPFVIHGGSGVTMDQRRALAGNSNICKFNIGTELRQTFGKALRSALDSDPNAYDRIEILKQTHDPVVTATRRILRNLKPD